MDENSIRSCLYRCRINDSSVQGLFSSSFTEEKRKSFHLCRCWIDTPRIKSNVHFIILITDRCRQTWPEDFWFHAENKRKKIVILISEIIIHYDRILLFLRFSKQWKWKYFGKAEFRRHWIIEEVKSVKPTKKTSLLLSLLLFIVNKGYFTLFSFRLHWNLSCKCHRLISQLFINLPRRIPPTCLNENF